MSTKSNRTYGKTELVELCDLSSNKNSNNPNLKDPSKIKSLLASLPKKSFAMFYLCFLLPIQILEGIHLWQRIRILLCYIILIKGEMSPHLLHMHFPRQLNTVESLTVLEASKQTLLLLNECIQILQRWSF